MSSRRPSRIVLLGAPGAGKGTVALGMVSLFGAPHLSSGDMLRAAVAAGNELGERVKGHMAAGQFVPDALILEVIRERVQHRDCRNDAGGVRYLLDGFPRTLVQAEAFAVDSKLAPQLVVHLKVNSDVIVGRLTGRRTCPNCGASFHVAFAPPAKTDACDHCGSGLIVRPDDHEDTIRRRLTAYELQTAPLIDYYADLLIEIDGGQGRDQVLADVIASLKPWDGETPVGANL